MLYKQSHPLVVKYPRGPQSISKKQKVKKYKIKITTYKKFKSPSFSHFTNKKKQNNKKLNIIGIAASVKV